MVIGRRMRAASAPDHAADIFAFEKSIGAPIVSAKARAQFDTKPVHLSGSCVAIGISGCRRAAYRDRGTFFPQAPEIGFDILRLSADGLFAAAASRGAKARKGYR